jgi:hypothetical protein
MAYPCARAGRPDRGARCGGADECRASSARYSARARRCRRWSGRCGGQKADPAETQRLRKERDRQGEARHQGGKAGTRSAIAHAPLVTSSTSTSMMVYVRETLACSCGETIVTAALTRRRTRPGMLRASLHLTKCSDIPLYRLEKQYQRVGVPIARSTMTDLFHRNAEVLAPLVKRLIQSLRHRLR